MAESLSHKFGQIIGDLLELAIEPHLQKFVKHNKLFLDKKGTRLTRKGKKLSWSDGKGNIHDLDFVLERGGTNNFLGVPVAFIEIAWRKSTRHSRNKVQEIQGAILPLADKYRNSSPFLGVLLAGRFTSGAINQLKSSGFTVLYFPVETIIKAFKKFEIDVDSDDLTSEEEYKNKIDSWNKLSNKPDVAKELLRLNKKEVDVFFNTLKESVSRFIEHIYILPLHGQVSIINSLAEAISFLKEYSEAKQILPLLKFEVIIKYNTGDKIEAVFKNKKDTIKFLEAYL